MTVEIQPNSSQVQGQCWYKVIITDQVTSLTDIERVNIFKPRQNSLNGQSNICLSVSKLIANQLGYNLELDLKYTKGCKYILRMKLQVGKLQKKQASNDFAGRSFGTRKRRTFKKPLGIAVIYELN